MSKPHLMQITQLSESTVFWWKDKAITEGFVYKGRAKMSAFMTAIQMGEYQIIKTKKNESDNKA